MVLLVTLLPIVFTRIGGVRHCKCGIVQGTRLVMDRATVSMTEEIISSHSVDA